MNTNFITDFIKQYVKGNIAIDDKLTGIKNGLSTLLAQLNEARALLYDTEQAYAELIPAFILNQNVPDVDPSSITQDNAEKYIVEITEDIANTILSSCDNVYHMLDNNASGNFKISISDAVGQVYALFKCDQNASRKRNQVVTPLISFIDPDDIVSTDQVLMYIQEGKYFLNYRWIPQNYQYTPEVPLTITTISQGLAQLNDLLSLSDNDPSSEDIMVWLDDVFNNHGWMDMHQQVRHNIETRILKLLDLRGLTSTGVIINDIQYLINDVTQADDGNAVIPRLAIDILHELAVADTINNVIDDAILLIQSQFSISDFIAQCKSKYANANLEIKTLWNNIVTTYNNGGVYAVAKYILTILQGAHGISTENGVLVVTDNSEIIPQSYIAGMLSGVWDVVSQVGMAIGLRFAGMLGPLLYYAGFIWKNFFSALQYDYAEETLAQVNYLDEILTLPCAPFSIAQGSIPITVSMVEHSEVVKTLNKLPGIYYAMIPGSYVLFSLNEDATEILYDVHPIICSCDTGFYYEDYLNVRQVAGQLPEYTYTYYNVYRKYTFDNRPITFNLQNILRIWNSRTPIQIDPSITGQLTEEEDNIVKAAVQRCIAITYLYCYFIVDTSRYITKLIPDFPVGLLVKRYDSISQTYTYNSYKLSTSGGEHLLFSDAGRDAIMLILGSSEFHGEFTESVEFQNYSTASTASWQDIISFATDAFKIGYISIRIPTISKAVSTGVAIISWNDTPLNVNFYPKLFATNILLYQNYIGNAVNLNSSYQYMIKIPKYDRQSFIPSVITLGIIATTAAVTGAVIAVKIRKFILNKRISNASKVEAAWNKQVAEPSEENMIAYRKTARKANIWQKFIGGTKYSVDNYWNTDSSGFVSDETGKYLSSIVSDSNTMLNDSSTPTVDNNLINNNIYLLCKYIVKIINNKDLQDSDITL